MVIDKSPFDKIEKIISTDCVKCRSQIEAEAEVLGRFAWEIYSYRTRTRTQKEMGESPRATKGGVDMNFRKTGTWWALPTHKKILRWLKVVPLAYIRATIEVHSVYKANKNGPMILTLHDAWRICIGVGERHLDRWYTWEK